MSILTRPTWVRWFDEFLYKPAYFFLVGFLTLCANICGGELFTYTCFTLIVLYLCIFGKDLLPVLPLAICAYISPSRQNNPGVNDGSVFSLAEGGAYILVLAGIMILGLLYRLIADRKLGRSAFWTCKRKLLPGILLLCASYLFSGLGTSQLSAVGKQNLVFALIQCASILVLYYVLTAMVHWEKAPVAYLAWTGMCVGYVLLLEMAYIHLQHDVIRYGTISRQIIYSGWGHYNNFGVLLAAMIPFPFFLTGKGKHSIVFYLSALLFLGGAFFTFSRSSMIFASLAFCVSFAVSLIHNRRIKTGIAVLTLIVLAGLSVCFLYSDKLLHLFRSLLEYGTDSGGRFAMYEAGIRQFLDYPLFGGTFYPVDFSLFSWSTSEAFVAFFPPRWHNTIIQILASCGIVGITAYAIHRWQTLLLFLRRPSCKKMFAFLSMLTLLGCSLLDCHMFNVGPMLFYSMMLAFAEKKLDK